MHREYGESYEEALENTKEVLEDLMYGYEKTLQTLPTPQTLKIAS